MNGCQRDPLLCILRLHEEEKKMSLRRPGNYSGPRRRTRCLPAHVRFRCLDWRAWMGYLRHPTPQVWYLLTYPFMYLPT